MTVKVTNASAIYQKYWGQDLPFEIERDPEIDISNTVGGNYLFGVVKAFYVDIVIKNPWAVGEIAAMLRLPANSLLYDFRLFVQQPSTLATNIIARYYKSQAGPDTYNDSFKYIYDDPIDSSVQFSIQTPGAANQVHPAVRTLTPNGAIAILNESGNTITDGEFIVTGLLCSV